MQTQTIATLLLAVLCQLCAVWFAWHWWLPILKTISHRPIEQQLARTGEIGFDEQRVRERLFMIETLILIAIGAATWFYLGVVLGATMLGILFHLRSLVLNWVIDSRERLLRDQTLALTNGLEGLVRGGLGLSQAVEMLAIQTAAPLGTMISRISSDFRRGLPLAEAINSTRAILRLDAFSLLVTSIICALRQGSSLEASLAGVQESLEHRAKAEYQLRTKTATARSTIVMLACIPLFFLSVFWFMMPGSLQLLFTTSSGKLLVAVILAMLYAGVAWARRLLIIK